MVAERRRHAFALADVLHHPAADDVTAGEVFLLRFVVGHKAVAVHIPQDPTVSAAPFGEQDPRRDDGGRVELHRFGVAQGADPRLQHRRLAGPFADDRVGRRAVDAPPAARGDAGGPGDVGFDLARDLVADHRAVAAVTLQHQPHQLFAFVDLHLVADGAVGDAVEHRVAGGVGGVAGAPLFGAAEIPGVDEPVGLLTLDDRGALGVDDHLAGAFAYAAPGDAPVGQFADRLGRGGDEHPSHLLVASPVAPFDRIGEVDIFVVPLPHHRVGEARLHPPLGRGRVGALDGNEGEDDGVEPLLLGLDRYPQARQAAADDQGVAVVDLHDSPPLIA